MMEACGREAFDGGWQHCGILSMVRQKIDPEIEAMGKFRGGLSTTIHATVNTLGNQIRLLLTPGQA